MPHWPIPPFKKGIKYDLNRIRALMDVLGDPHLKLPPIIHVAGTNGKGSTIAFLRSIFEKAGYKVHAYTSPHLIEFNERIVISSEKISDNELFYFSEYVRNKSIEIDPTFFEGTTAIALLAFSQRKADVLLLETGMGGRLDATNIIENPILTVITPISFDHMEYLGSTLPIIAREKGGIIKPHVPCVISAQTEEVMDELFKICEKNKSMPYAFEYDFGIQIKKGEFSFLSKEKELSLSYPSLKGDHQVLNASTAIASINLIKDKFNINDQNIMDGITHAFWPARIQQIKYRDFNLYVDAAHNSGGAQVLSHWIKDNVKPPMCLILGMTHNRNVEEFTKYFKGLVNKVFTVTVKSEPLSYSADDLKKLVPEYFEVQSYENIEEVFDDINDNIRNNYRNIIVTGSTFLASDLFKICGISC